MFEQKPMEEDRIGMRGKPQAQPEFLTVVNLNATAYREYRNCFEMNSPFAASTAFDVKSG